MKEKMFSDFALFILMFVVRLVSTSSGWRILLWGLLQGSASIVELVSWNWLDSAYSYGAFSWSLSLVTALMCNAFVMPNL